MSISTNKNSLATTACNELSQHAEQINAYCKSAEASAQKAIHAAVMCGNLLRKAKELCKHGEWQNWLESNCELSYRTSAKYIRLSENWPAIQSNVPWTAHLTIDGALALIAEPRPVDVDVSKCIQLDTKPKTESQYRELAKLEPEKIPQVWEAVSVEEQIIKNVPHAGQKPTSQRQYEELAKLEPEKIPQVWEAVTKECEETGEQPTAKKIKQFAAEIVEPEFEYVEVDESEIEPGDIDCGPVDWKPAHRKAIACCTALMRAIDDLNEVKSNDDHKRLSANCDVLWEGLKKWNG